MDKIFDSNDLAGPDRVDAWRHITSSALVPTEFHIPEPASFAARLDATTLGVAQVTALRYGSLRSTRTARLIRRSDPEQYQVGVVLTGRQGIDQNRTCACLDAGQLVLYDSSQRFEAVVGDCAAESVVLQFPKRLLPLPAARVDRLLARPIPATHGIGRLVTRFLVGLVEDRAEFSPHDALRLGHTTIDLVSALLAHCLDDDTPPPHSPTYLLYLRIVSFVDDTLHQPDLAPATIASAHNISVRYLHRIFQQHHPVSVTAHLRHRRLDRCRRDLTDPTLRHRTIAAIAARWGFTRSGEFSRTFRRETGMSPSDYRTEALSSRQDLN
ncbi:helix-turn-helix domain-containing protein [Actinosynnema sp. NPDC050436]|uniref:AraC-like ligand-binding domain-containing protein n=1 Tax=Actinosynnema sp. NPDC050436 TaxID=3155659 RepID=UPI0033CB4565